LLSTSLWSQRAGHRHSERTCGRHADKPWDRLACPIVAANPVWNPRLVHINTRKGDRKQKSEDVHPRGVWLWHLLTGLG
jgi:hypothetical protein